jgi:hypothetical protein
MALALAQPAAAVRHRPVVKLNGVLAERAEPWAESILFGSAADLAGLLKRGLAQTAGTLMARRR